ncbi:hypothetical protein Ddc_14598 [Ditylenchus destructor]|nr:hypothetical protein Ddc_14598 [Ditylenchus destructor]
MAGNLLFDCVKMSPGGEDFLGLPIIARRTLLVQYNNSCRQPRTTVIREPKCKLLGSRLKNDRRKPRKEPNDWHVPETK